MFKFNKNQLRNRIKSPLLQHLLISPVNGYHHDRMHMSQNCNSFHEKTGWKLSKMASIIHGLYILHRSFFHDLVFIINSEITK